MRDAVDVLDLAKRAVAHPKDESKTEPLSDMHQVTCSCCRFRTFLVPEDIANSGLAVCDFCISSGVKP